MRPDGLAPGGRAVFVLFGVISAVITVFAYWLKPAFLTGMDLKATDAMFAARGASAAPSQVVVVAIDEKSINSIGRWPWTRGKTARLVRALKPARVVAIDIVFSEEENDRADSELADAIKDAGNVTLGYFFRDDSSTGQDPASLTQINRSRISLVRYAGGIFPDAAAVPAPEFTGVETDTPKIGEGSKGFGSFNMTPGADGIYRSAPLVFKYGSGIYPSLSLDAVSRYSGGAVTLNAAAYGIDSVSIKDVTIPVNEGGAFSLNFYGRAGTFTTYPAIDVMEGRVNADALKDRLVFVGVTETAVYDIRPTPVDSLFPGVEIHATVAGNVIERRFLIRDTRVVIFDLLMAVFMPIALSAVLGGVRRAYVSLLVFAGLFIVLVLLDFHLFSAYGIKPGVVYPALSLTLAYLTGEAYRNAVVEKKSRFLKKAFSTYVSSQLVSEILKDPNRLKLGGEKRVITVLFSDIRGFTGLSEKLPPERLVALLNEYLNPMTRIVLEEEGMLDKYIGDAVMAVFNAPLEIREHPGKACSAALKMMSRLDGLNAVWREEGYPAIDIGIGINTGEAVVGNMGAELRFDYTAIGDTVNLASRLEGMNKLYGTHILVAESTYTPVREEFVFREIDLVRVKGKQ
ncbi:MAG: adenylate/guanylate cyclase domain-containing protein, partial [Deltaproteobacteria bacterium]